jgi:hypothetical protein
MTGEAVSFLRVVSCRLIGGLGDVLFYGLGPDLYHDKFAPVPWRTWFDAGAQRIGPESLRAQPTLFGFNDIVCTSLLCHGPCFAAVSTGTSCFVIMRGVACTNKTRNFEVRHPRCVSNKSNCKVYAYFVKYSYALGSMLFNIRKAQLHLSATNFGHHQVVQWKRINQMYMHL